MAVLVQDAGHIMIFYQSVEETAWLGKKRINHINTIV